MASGLSGAPGMGVDLAVKVRYGGWLTQPSANGKGARRETGSGGSRRQTSAPRDAKRIRGHVVRASQPDMAKIATIMLGWYGGCPFVAVYEP